MSGESSGLLLIPLVIAGGLPLIAVGLAGAGIAAGVAAGVEAASDSARRRQANEAERRRREAAREQAEAARRAEDGRVENSIGSYRSQMKATMKAQSQLDRQTSKQMTEEIKQSRAKMSRIAAANDPEKYEKFMGEIRQSEQSLTDRFNELQEDYVKNYHAKIEESMDEISKSVNAKYSEYIEELASIENGDTAKKKKAMEIADSYLKETQMLITSFEEDYLGKKFSPLALTELKSQLNAAIDQYNNENYQAALATAKDVSLSTIEEIYKADLKKREWDNYYELADSLASELKAYLESQSVVTEEAKKQAETQIGKPIEDDVVGIRISDYTDRMQDGTSQYDFLLKKATEIKQFLESEDSENLSTEQLKQYVDLLNTKMYPSAALSIYKGILNMSNAFSRQNISEDIIDFFEDHNFTFKGYSYDDDRHDGALHIGLENEPTGEEIIVTLSPELMENGEVQTKVDIDQLMGDEANEDRKQFYRTSVEDVVVGNTPGAQIKIQCKKEYKNRLSDRTQLRDRLKQ